MENAYQVPLPALTRPPRPSLSTDDQARADEDVERRAALVAITVTEPAGGRIPARAVLAGTASGSGRYGGVLMEAA